MSSTRKTLTTYSLLTMGVCIMLIIRMIHSGKSTFDFMILNLFLAWIPFLISTVVTKIKSRPFKVILGFCWLLFIPNAPYMVTDIMHIKIRDITPIWYDVLLLQSFSLLGLFICFSSLEQIWSVVATKFHRKYRETWMIFMYFLISFGVALGRFFRINSWEVFTEPANLLHDMLGSFTNPMIWLQAVIFTVCFFALLCGLHVLLKLFEKN